MRKSLRNQVIRSYKNVMSIKIWELKNLWSLFIEDRRITFKNKSVKIINNSTKYPVVLFLVLSFLFPSTSCFTTTFGMWTCITTCWILAWSRCRQIFPFFSYIIWHTRRIWLSRATWGWVMFSINFLWTMRIIWATWRTIIVRGSGCLLGCWRDILRVVSRGRNRRRFPSGCHRSTVGHVEGLPCFIKSHNLHHCFLQNFFTTEFWSPIFFIIFFLSWVLQIMKNLCSKLFVSRKYLIDLKHTSKYFTKEYLYLYVNDNAWPV